MTEPKCFSEAHIHQFMSKVAASLDMEPLVEASNPSREQAAPMNQEPANPCPHRLIDYCQWCGWSDYKENMTKHLAGCAWKQAGRSKPI
jgi:hypothetical protein